MIVRDVRGYHTIPDGFVDPAANVATMVAVLLGVLAIKNEYSLGHLWTFTIVAVGLFYVPLRIAVLSEWPSYLPDDPTSLTVLVVVVLLLSYSTADYLTYQAVYRRFRPHLGKQDTE